jgi:hypothetical protein
LAGLGYRFCAMEPGEELRIVIFAYQVLPLIYIAVCGNYQYGQITLMLFSLLGTTNELQRMTSSRLASSHSLSLISFDDSFILSLPYSSPPLTYHHHHTSLLTCSDGASQAVEANAAHTLGRGHGVACQWQCDRQTKWTCAQTKLQVV